MDYNRMLNERDQSEFNMAVSWLNRLNYWFYICDESSSAMDSYQWFQSLIILFRELSTEMKAEEIIERNTELEQIWNIINKQIIMQNKQQKKIMSRELYWKLHKFEIFLRTILKSSGLQNKMKESAMDALR